MGLLLFFQRKKRLIAPEPQELYVRAPEVAQPGPRPYGGAVNWNRQELDATVAATRPSEP
jgi:hypothetical protein